jgi:hypothetical protein
MSSAFSAFLKGMNTAPSLSSATTPAARPGPQPNQGADAMAMILGALEPDRMVTLPALAGLLKLPPATLFAGIEKLEELRLVERRITAEAMGFALTPDGVAFRSSSAT